MTKIKFDQQSLERLVNESYESIISETGDLDTKIQAINQLTEQNAAIGLQQYGEIYARLVETKGKVSDRLIKLTQLVKELHKLEEAKSKGSGSSSGITAEDLARMAEEYEEEKARRQIEDND